jgi:holo-[acyl-carrier protein] synthase
VLYGIGTDIVEIKRILEVSRGERFALRILTSAEMAEYRLNKFPEHYLAKKYAAKEALVKATGTGIGNGYSWQMMQVEHDDLGKPYFVFFDKMKLFMQERKIVNCQLSISDEQAYATAMVVLEAKE